MVALQIRDVPNDVRDILAARARSMGQSLQSLLLSLVTEEARRSRNIALLHSLDGRTDGVSDADPTAGLVSGYDATYVVTAQVNDCPLVTGDARLARGAESLCDVRLTVRG